MVWWLKKHRPDKREVPNWSYLCQILIQTGSDGTFPFIRTVALYLPLQTQVQKARPQLIEVCPLPPWLELHKAIERLEGPLKNDAKKDVL